MKLQASRELLKAILSPTNKNNNLCLNFPVPPIIECSKCLNSLFQNQHSVLLCPLFYKKYHNSQLRPYSFRLTLPYILQTPSYFISFRSVYWFFCQTCMSHHIWIIQIRFRLFENIFVSQKIESRHFYSCPPGKKSPLGSFHCPNMQRNISYLTRHCFSKIFFHLQ